MPTAKTPHHGKNIKRLREILDIKQDSFARAMGPEWDQQKVSRLEKKRQIDDDMMEQVSRIFNMPADVIKNFDEEKAINIVTNTFQQGSTNNGAVGNGPWNECTFNPLDKIVELYEALVKSEREKVAILEKFIQDSQSKKG